MPPDENPVTGIDVLVGAVISSLDQIFYLTSPVLAGFIIIGLLFYSYHLAKKAL
jgi:hypothetical protein